MRSIAISVLAALLLSGCSFNCITATGPVEERTVEVPSFTGIDVSGAAQVTVEKGDVQKITVKGQADVIDLLETNVSGGVWKITTSKCFTSDQGLEVRITTPSAFTSVESSGSADVSLANVFGTEKIELSTSGSSTIAVAELNSRKLNVEISGSGSVTVRGTCAELDASLSGSGDLQAVDLAANAATIDVSGSGSATVKAISTLDADVSGAGEVRYSGKPNVRSSISGSGSVMPLP